MTPPTFVPSVTTRAAECPHFDSSSAEVKGHPLGVELEVFIRREDAERFIEEVRGDDPEIAATLRIEERELEAGALN